MNKDVLDWWMSLKHPIANEEKIKKQIFLSNFKEKIFATAAKSTVGNMITFIQQLRTNSNNAENTVPVALDRHHNVDLNQEEN